MRDRKWSENLGDFYQFVRNGSEMDVKNQSDWQHSAFIYDGELVDQDVPGNINYGYFWKILQYSRFCFTYGCWIRTNISGNIQIGILSNIFR